MAVTVVDNTYEIAKPIIPYIGPKIIIPIINAVNPNPFAIKINFDFSKDKNLDKNMVEILDGTTSNDKILIALIASMYFGKYIEIISGNIKYPNNAITIDTNIKYFLIFLVETFVESCGKMNLKTIALNEFKIIKI